MSTLYMAQPGASLPCCTKHLGITSQRLFQTNNCYLPCYIYAQQILKDAVYNKFQKLGCGIAYSASGTNCETGDENATQIGDPLDSEQVGKILGKNGTIQDGVLKFTFPRYDLKVNVGAISIEPEFALTSWMAFHHVGNQSMVMGDLVLMEGEIDLVISQLIANGIEITAVHNHLLQELPRIMYLHILGIGDAVKLAQGIKNVLSITQTPLAAHTVSQTLPQEYWSTVEKIMGKRGNRIGRVIQFSFPRADNIKEFGVEIPPSMGISQAINFQAEGQYASATGDFVLIAKEVNPVIRTLKQYGITITAIHNHMLYESPRLFFLHFWAVDNPEKLAYGLRQSLGQTNTVFS